MLRRRMQKISAKVRDLRHLQIALNMRFYYHKQPILHIILLYYYYTLILSYISVIMSGMFPTKYKIVYLNSI
jgi:hypothetical protein